MAKQRPTKYGEKVKSPKLTKGSQAKSEGFDKAVEGAGVKVPTSADMRGGNGDWNKKVDNQTKSEGFPKVVRGGGVNDKANAYSTVKKAQKGDSDY